MIPGPAGSALDHPEIVARFIEDVGPVSSADDDILDPGSVTAGEVDPGLHAEGDASAQQLAVAGDEVRLLVDLEIGRASCRERV